MNNQTNIEKIRQNAIMLLYLDIKPTEIDFIASHPFTTSWFVINGNRMLDLHKEEDLNEWRTSVEKLVNKLDLFHIVNMVNKVYRLFFLKLSKEYISAKDMGECLQSAWQNAENISTDPNVSGQDLVKMFKMADKTSLMTKEEREYMESLSDSITVWRGVSDYNKNKEKALSWTVNKDKAIWFATRFDSNGELWETTIPKNRVLACFTTNGTDSEGEVIVNLYRFQADIKKLEVGRK